MKVINWLEKLKEVENIESYVKPFGVQSYGPDGTMNLEGGLNIIEFDKDYKAKRSLKKLIEYACEKIKW